MSKRKLLTWNGVLRLATGSLLLTGTCMMLASCQTMVSGATKASGYCTVFKPISWSKNDTLETAKQIREHNAVWKEICGGKTNGGVDGSP